MWCKLGCSLAFLWCVHAAAELSPDPYRLDSRIRPTAESLELTLDPSADRYQGRARVNVDFGVSTNQFRFHAQALDLGQVSLDGKALTMKTEAAGLVSAAASESITTGAHVLEIEFSNDYNRDGTGLYKAVAGQRSYLFTQMEAQYARQAFPCWDEPRFKIPWRITVTVPSGLEVVGNMPIAQTTMTGTNKVVAFGRTPPMSSYLVALAVGPLEYRNVPGQLVPGQLVTVQGQTELGELAAKEAPALLGALEGYFGVPYPYPKLDHIAAPGFVFGAMENAGAIIYKDSLLLSDSRHVSYENRRRLIEVIAHEMAHMWFGDLVTMEWWDDVWLNESFATWMAVKTAERTHPDDRFHMLSFEYVRRARAADTQPSVRAIRRLFHGDDNILEAIDVLSYQKGQSILRMIEGWLGQDQFRQGLRQYFHRHQWANARAEDLWRALGEAGDPAVSEVMRRYIEQPGVPELTFTRLPGDRLELRQRRYRSIIGENVAEQTWHVPIVLRYGVGSTVKEFRFLLTKPTEEVHVPGLDQANWVYPNAGEMGYFTWSLAPDLANALTNRALIPLSDIERLGLLDAAGLAVRSGTLPADKALNLLLSCTSDSAAEIKDRVVGDLAAMERTYANGDNRPAFAKLIRSTLRPMLDSIGFEPRPSEAPEIGPLRGSLLRVLGHAGNDSDVVAFCREQARRQLADPHSVDAGIGPVALEVTSWHGDAQWSGQLRAAFESAKAPAVRQRFLGALSRFQDPALLQSALDYLLTDAVRPAELVNSLRRPGDTESAAVLFDWVVTRYDRIKARIPGDQLPFLSNVLLGGDQALLEKGRAFFLDPARKTPLAETQFQKAAESVALSSALRERYSADVVRRVKELAEASAN
jgi:cytosol alanyl aminopeptidase